MDVHVTPPPGYPAEMSGARVGAAYDARAEEYVARLGALDQMAPEDRATIGQWSAAHPGRLLDAGCGPGH